MPTGNQLLRSDSADILGRNHGNLSLRRDECRKNSLCLCRTNHRRPVVHKIARSKNGQSLGRTAESLFPITHGSDRACPSCNMSADRRQKDNMLNSAFLHSFCGTIHPCSLIRQPGLSAIIRRHHQIHPLRPFEYLG